MKLLKVAVIGEGEDAHSLTDRCVEAAVEHGMDDARVVRHEEEAAARCVLKVSLNDIRRLTALTDTADDAKLGRELPKAIK